MSTTEKSIAQQCLEASKPEEWARTKSAYKGRPSQDILRFHFEDGSCLDFRIELTPLKAGRIYEDGR